MFVAKAVYHMPTERLHEALVKKSYQDERGGQSVEGFDRHRGQEKPAKKDAPAKPKAKRGRLKLLGYTTAEAVRYHERSTVERAYARLKDEFGGRFDRVRGECQNAGIDTKSTLKNDDLGP